jgi:CubicO group peptidase (beta-lactamase class C family)
MDPALLDQLQAEIKSSALPLHSLLIIRNGRIVSETYYPGGAKNSASELYSVTKSFVSTLVGIAVDQGKLTDLHTRVVSLLPGEYANPDPRKDSLTVENLLTMSSGLDWQEGDSAYRTLYMSPDWVAYMLNLPIIEDPGTRFNYCSGCTHLLSAVVQKVSGQNTLDFARKTLFGPLGIKNPAWEKDRAGVPIGGWGLSLTARDMAKLGYLYLHNGTWDGRQIVSASWVKAATSKHATAEGRLDYGYQWWVARKDGAYAALGRDGQMIYVDPTRSLVVVTKANMPGNHDPLLDLIDRYIVPAAR